MAEALAGIAERAPGPVADEADTLLRTMNSTDEYPNLEGTALMVLSRVASHNPGRLTTRLQFFNEYLNHEQSALRAHSAALLAELASHDATAVVESNSVEPLIECLDAPVFETRINATVALGRIGQSRPEVLLHKGATEPLANLLASENATLQHRATVALETVAQVDAGRVIQSGAVERFVDFLEDGSSKLQSNAAAALVPIAEQEPEELINTGAFSELVRLVLSPNSRVQSNVLGALIALSARRPESLLAAGIIDVLAESLGTGNLHKTHHTNAGAILNNIVHVCPEATREAGGTGVLETLLNSPDPSARYNATVGLARLATVYPATLAKVGIVGDKDTLSEHQDSKTTPDELIDLILERKGIEFRPDDDPIGE